MSKEKIIEEQFLLLINGPSCGGKSTVTDILFERYGHIYKAKSDVIKWLISDYHAPTYREVVHIMTLETMRVALAHKLSVIKEGASFQNEAYTEMASQAKVPLSVVNIEAPWDVLLSRFEQRIEAKRQGAKISNTDPVRFKELYDMYLNTKQPNALHFDSSVQSPDEIADAIVEHLRKSGSASMTIK